MDQIAEELIGKIIHEKYELIKELGRGSFGIVFVGINIDTNQIVAVKCESTKSKKRHLVNENTVYELLQGKEGFPVIYFYGKWEDFEILIMEYLGPSIKKLFYQCNNKFDVATVANLAIQCLYRLEDIHNAGFLHQDIKPENLTIGDMDSDRKHIIYLIDFGTSTAFKDIETGVHMEPGEASRIVGTCRYAALRMHYGYICSRRDDLESLGYSLIYWLQGSLPWQSVRESDPRKKWKIVRSIKRQYIIDSDYLKKLPEAVQDFFKYVQSLGFYTKPNYRILRGIFRRLYKQTKEYENRKTKPYCWVKFLDSMKRPRIPSKYR